MDIYPQAKRFLDWPDSYRCMILGPLHINRLHVPMVQKAQKMQSKKGKRLA